MELGKGLKLFFGEMEENSEDVEDINNYFEKAKKEKNPLISFAYYFQVILKSEDEKLKSKAYNNLAIILYQEEYEKKAIEYLKKAIECDNENINAKENLEEIDSNR
ncbi:tetratricopeptide repeat protein [Haliovirga abyssi]|uniref:Tetratricopeptide repeat protein n=1 Tax=Haliovirga abyssi TaxID=2996794 RepID=A0AAU9D509_9FUSO|nr:hypothetical protein [Haliovirga abyssi]BDU49638.1 hypothetical protein HLVA_02070 [Haliovirga abyssi]